VGISMRNVQLAEKHAQARMPVAPEGGEKERDAGKQRVQGARCNVLGILSS
jgi:hypothetical protein